MLARRLFLCCLFAVTVVAAGAGRLLPGSSAHVVEAGAPEADAALVSTPAPAPVDLAISAATPGIDHSELPAALAAAGVELPDGAGVYAVRLDDQAAFDAGAGAAYDGFWPASSVKLLAAVGALGYLGELGFTGNARIAMAGDTFTVADVYTAAIADSSNEAYDLLVQIAGVDWLNEVFLTEANGFPDTVIQRSYTGWGVDVSPAMTIVEDGRRHEVAARRAMDTYDCPETGNCSTLLELAESVRRVTLDAADRFDVAEADLAGLSDALLATEGFVEPAVAELLGDGVPVFNKPGYVPGADCVDVALVADRYLLAVTTPEDGPLCPTLVEVVVATVKFLEELGGDA